MRDKTIGIANTHKFSSILIPRRLQTPRTTKVTITPTDTHPDARNIYCLTIGECNYRLRGEVRQVCLVQEGLRGSGGDLFPAPHHPSRSVFPPEPALGASAAYICGLFPGLNEKEKSSHILHGGDRWLGW